LFEGRLLMSIYSQNMDGRICNIKSMFSKESKTSRHVKRGRDTKIPQSSGPPVKVGDEVVHKELGDRMERVATTASSLEVEQDSGSGLRCQDTILGDVDAQTRSETTSKQSNDPPLSIGYTHRSGEDINAARPNLVLPVQVNAAEGDSINTTIQDSSIRSDLHLEDAGGTDCLPTATIFEELAQMGNLKIFFSKYIIDAMVKHLEGGVKFFMYPRFLQVFINQQLGDMSHNQLKSKSYEDIQKLFDNEMRRVNTFIPMDSEEVKSKKGTQESSKGTEDELKSDKSKKA
ncbi:hypothetical protein Tco_0502134, partial [Tanacetum coccineum]